MADVDLFGLSGVKGDGETLTPYTPLPVRVSSIGAATSIDSSLAPFGALRLRFSGLSAILQGALGLAFTPYDEMAAIYRLAVTQALIAEQPFKESALVMQEINAALSKTYPVGTEKAIAVVSWSV